MQEDFFFFYQLVSRENFISSINSIVLEDSSTRVFFSSIKPSWKHTQFHVIFDELRLDFFLFFFLVHSDPSIIQKRIEWKKK